MGDTRFDTYHESWNSFKRAARAAPGRIWDSMMTMHLGLSSWLASFFSSGVAKQTVLMHFGIDTGLIPKESHCLGRTLIFCLVLPRNIGTNAGLIDLQATHGSLCRKRTSSCPQQLQAQVHALQLQASHFCPRGYW